jgi:thymidine phosphorylase
MTLVAELIRRKRDGGELSAAEIEASESGVVTQVDVRAVGVGIVALGGGRARETERSPRSSRLPSARR